MKRAAASLLCLSLSLLAAPAFAKAPKCQLQSARGDIEHVIFVVFDNVHLSRDNPNVPSDLEQMPNLLNFIKKNGTLDNNHHTPLIAHTGTDILTALTGVYGDRHGVPISNSYRFFRPDLTSDPAGSFTYWTDPIVDFAQASTDPLPNMIDQDGDISPAPWVAFTRAGCNVGAVAAANIELENAGSDLVTVFGAGSPQALEGANNGALATADFVGVAVHCAKGADLCAAENGGVADLLPDEPKGYHGYQALFGHKYVAPFLDNSPLNDLDGNLITDENNPPNVGFPGFGGITAAQSLSYVAAMQEHGIPVTYAYISDAHDDHVKGGTFGPGEAGYVAALKNYDRAFGKFFDRLADDGIDESNTLFIFTADEGDHFVGAAQANCDGVTTPCTYVHQGNGVNIGELDTNLTGLLAAQGNVTPLTAHSDSAPNLYVNGQPDPDDKVTRKLEKDLAAIQVFNSLTQQNEALVNFLADFHEMKLLHILNSDPQRDPTLTVFAKPDYFVHTGAGNCGQNGCVFESPSFAWNHGDVGADINRTWLGFVGPGVKKLGETDHIWSDHADVRPTILALAGLKDHYHHQGRLLIKALHDWAVPAALEKHEQVAEQLGEVYKQINASVGPLGLDSLKFATAGLLGTEKDFKDAEKRVKDWTKRRDALAEKIEKVLDGVTFDGDKLNVKDANDLIDDAQDLLDEVHKAAN